MPLLRPILLALACALSLGCRGRAPVTALDPPPPGALRVAVYNIYELSTRKLSYVDAFGRGLEPQVVAAAEVIKRVRPDILVVLELDHDYTQPGLPLETNVERLQRHYLSQGADPIEYPHVFVAPCNTGILSGIDLDRNGRVATPDSGERDYGGDCFGFGNYPGQYSMAILSRVPLDAGAARTFQRFLWRDLPGSHVGEDLFSPEGLAVARLSSKSHWDVPVVVGGVPVHLLVSHPTPQGFDGPEDRNGRRNFDEILFWRRYIDGSDALVDDAGVRGGLAKGAEFVILGDMNATPGQGSEYDGGTAMEALLAHPRVMDTGEVAVSRGALRGRPAGPPDHPERATFEGVRGRRIDYVLPSRGLRVLSGGVFWPSPEEHMGESILAEFASDHRLVWMDIAPGAPE